jgi:pimeloyl-ACP methyl ester carboxylesterase
VWGVGYAELAVNRRERAEDGTTTILGWNPDNLVDDQVTALQLRRPDESVVGTVVSFGCHPVTTGFDMLVYSADFPGPMRDVVRRFTGGECVFLQGAGGNVLPKVAFTNDEREAELMGSRIGLEALHSLAGRFARPHRMVWKQEGSVMPISAYRREAQADEPPALAATMEHVRFPLLPHPTLDEVRAVRDEWGPRVAEALDAAIAAMMTRPDSTPDLARISVGTLVVVGEEDAVTPVAEAEAMHRALGRSTLTVLPGAGHLSNLEQPDAFSKALADFLLAHL